MTSEQRTRQSNGTFDRRKRFGDLCTYLVDDCPRHRAAGVRADVDLCPHVEPAVRLPTRVAGSLLGVDFQEGILVRVLRLDKAKTRCQKIIYARSENVGFFLPEAKVVLHILECFDESGLVV